MEIVVEQLGFKDAKPVGTPGIREEGRTHIGMEVKLQDAGASTY